MTAFWHAFADMAAVEGRELTLVRGEGVYVWDDTGRRYLDGSASLWYANVGHGRHEIAEAIAAQLVPPRRNTFGDLTNRPPELTARLAALH
jgi:adenosylmethionine-8-amino-7-oxononanoate aminotransferase